MATVAGLNNKLIAAVEAAVKDVFSDMNSAEFKALAKVVGEEGGSNAAYIELERSDQARYGLIKRFQSKPPSKETLASVKETLKELSAKQIQALKTLHAQQLEKMEDELASTPQATEANKHRILEVLKKAQKEQIEGVKKIGEEDQQNLTDFHRKFNRRMSAAMIIRHLGKEHDKDVAEKAKDMAGQMAGTSSKPDLVQRFTLWGLLPNAVLKRSETLRGWVGKSKEGYEYEDWGGVEHEFARSYSMRDLVYKDGRWEYEEPTDKKKNDERSIAAEQGRASGRPPRKKEEEDIWAINIQDDYFKSTSTHEYTDLGAAGALTPTSIPLKIFGAIFGGFTGGKFTIKYDYMPPNEELKLPGGPGLTMDLAGGSLLSNSENMVRVGVLAHEAMARGWDSIEFRRMTPELKDEAYLAARRAGFAHEEIFYYGQLYSDELKRRGDYQRGIIEKAWEDKKPLNEIAGLAFNLPNPQIASPTEFFGQADPQDVLTQFNDPLTSRSQRAELLNDAASYAFDNNFGPMFAGNLTQEQQKDAAAFLGELAMLDKARALEMYGVLSRHPVAPAQPNSHIQFNVFKHLGALGANPGVNPFLASVIMSEAWYDGNQQQIDDRRAALFKAISADSPEKLESKAYLLLDDTLPSSVAAKLYHSVPEDGEQRTDLLKALADITRVPNADKLARLLVGLYHHGNLQPDANKGISELFDKISDQMPFFYRGPRLEAMKKAFINHPELTFDERKRFLEDLEHTLDPSQMNYREFLSLMTAENAFFYLEDKYGDNFRAEFLEAVPFFGESVDSDRLNKFVEIYERTYNLNPLDPDAVANPPVGGRFHTRVTAHIGENTQDYDGLAHAVAFFWSESQQSDVLELDRNALARGRHVQPDTLPLTAPLDLQVRELLLMNSVHAAKILDRLSDDVVDKIMVQIVRDVNRNEALAVINAFLGLAAAPSQDNQLDIQKVARSILRLPPQAQTGVLALLATARNDETKQKSYYKLLRSLGARTAARMISAHPNNNELIFSILRDLAAVQATPDNPNPLIESNPDNVKFLAKVLTACVVYPNNGGVDISAIPLSAALRAEVLKQTNNKEVIKALMKGAIAGIPDQQDQVIAWGDIVSAMEKNADKAKVFGGIPRNRQTAVLMTLPDKVQAAVFRGADKVIQEAFLAGIIGNDLNAMTAKAANQILRLVSPSASGDRNLFNDVLNQQEREAVLKKATVIRPELLCSLWKDGDFQTLAHIMDVTRFDGLQPAGKANAIDDYLEKVARAGLALTGDGDRPKAFFIGVLGGGNPQTVQVSQVRAHMLKELIDNQEKAKAKDFFDGLPQDHKTVLSNYIKTKYADHRFNALRGVVGVERIEPPEQQSEGPRQQR